MSDGAEEKAAAPAADAAASSPSRRLTTSFPQLRFGNFVVGDARTTTMPGLSKPSRLGNALLAARDDATSSIDSKTSIDQTTSDLVVDAARSFYKDVAGADLPAAYASVTLPQDGGASMGMLADYLLTGSTSHIDTLDKGLSMVVLLKTYGLCEDVLCERVLDFLKGVVTVKDVLRVIATVGHKALVEVWPSGVEGVGDPDSVTVWKMGDQFFFDLATDKAAEVFADGVVAMQLVNTHPLIAGLFLCQTPLAYEAKLPKPPAPEEEEEA